MGASAGGVEALSEVVSAFPADLPAAVFVVLHVPRHGSSVLASILDRRGPLPARVPADGEAIQHGTIYVAPPDYHLIVTNEQIHVTRGPSENGHRPAIDPLFRSAARAGRERVIGVVLSGMLDDGTVGSITIKRNGGTVVVQDPDDALFSSMPSSTIDNVAVDHIAAAKKIGALLVQLVSKPVPITPSDNSPSTNKEQTMNGSQEVDEQGLTEEVQAALMDPEALDGEDRSKASPSVFGCPECGGVLWEIQDKEIIRFRCRTGHAYSSDSLLAEQNDSIEAAMWTAFRALEESSSLARRLLERATQRGHTLAASRFAQQAEEATHRAAVIRHALLRGQNQSNNTESENTEPAIRTPTP